MRFIFKSRLSLFDIVWMFQLVIGFDSIVTFVGVGWAIAAAVVFFCVMIVISSMVEVYYWRKRGD
jgi:hypothetical protein